MTMNRHEPFEELISASLHGDLTADEDRRLNAHLDGCAQCRDTLAAYSDQRRMLAGLRHVAPPRDLGARVRAGVESGSIPWWRKPTTIFTAVGGSLAAVAGALLALVVLNGAPSVPPVGQASQTPTFEPAPTPSAPVSLPSFATPVPSTAASPGAATPTPAEATPTPVQVAASPEPDLYLAFDPATPPGDEESLAVVAGSTGDVVLDPDPPSDPPDPTATAGEPIAAELSSDATWLAYVSRQGPSGMDQVLVTHMGEGAAPAPEESSEPTPTPPAATGETAALGTSVAGSPFLERLAWSPDARWLAYTLADPNGSGTDAWVFDTATNESWQLTAVGDAYAASWVDVPESGIPALWVSRADGTATSYLTAVMTDAGERVERIDPAEEPIAVAPHVFLPLISPNGALAIYWDGVMTRQGDEWVFSEGGAPWLAEHRPLDESPFPSDRLLFHDLTISRDAFTSAAITWGLDGNSFAVWQTNWTGASQDPDGGTYPDPARVYFGHALDERGLTHDHALDADDLPTDWSVVDVKVSPTGQHLVVMVAEPLAGDLSVPTARLLLVTRNTGEVADVVDPLTPDDGRWYGPAVFDAYVEVEPEAETP
jgi:hypothetical protein